MFSPPAWCNPSLIYRNVLWVRGITAQPSQSCSFNLPWMSHIGLLPHLPCRSTLLTQEREKIDNVKVKDARFIDHRKALAAPAALLRTENLINWENVFWVTYGQLPIQGWNHRTIPGRNSKIAQPQKRSWACCKRRILDLSECKDTRACPFGLFLIPCLPVSSANNKTLIYLFCVAAINL